ncbi:MULTISPECIES: DNA glycosylase AlkZ-like family protein [Actinosynnema]|uniref:DNA glycosylase AlkZ-like family protein n=1 Tax=Actinosynnema TaxID=40566 RepID=UPI0020A354E4|nr:crosslink repair DNA glycosylase YcaQ family protein [Actinosynnema pretiosum]MCP2095724.1 Winged helix DNA-binding domain-containing protein [Actinosynnema pretiosum]
MTAVLEVDRAAVLAHRVAVQQFDRSVGRVADLAVLDVGVQDTPHGSAGAALVARLDGVPEVGDGVGLVWAARGAPHLHRVGELGTVAAALWPMSDADATARIRSGQIKAGAELGLAAFEAAAVALRGAVTGETGKGDASAAVSAAVPESLTFDCAGCGSRHVSGALFQQVGAAAGVLLEVSGRGTSLVPAPGRGAPPERARGVAGLIGTLLRVLGPAGPAEVARHLGARARDVREVWPSGLVEVRVGGWSGYLPADSAEALRVAHEARVVRLLPPGDPFLQGVDREFLVPGKAHRGLVWRALGAPGALLVDGEVAGVWRSRLGSGGKALRIAVTPFAALDARVTAGVEDEGLRLARARGLPGIELVVG